VTLQIITFVTQIIEDINRQKRFETRLYHNFNSVNYACNCMIRSFKKYFIRKPLPNHTQSLVRFMLQFFKQLIKTSNFTL